MVIKNTTPVNEVFNDLRTVLENIQQEPNTYSTELNMQTKDKDKFRWLHQDVLSMCDSPDHFDDNSAFFQVDMVIHAKDKFFESSCPYRMVPVMGMSLDKLVEELKEDIKVIYLPTNPKYSHVSSSMIRGLEKFDKIAAQNYKVIL